MSRTVRQPVRFPTSETKSERRLEIRAAAIQVFAEKGFDTATMRDIADAVGTRPGSLYHHFRSKDELLRELLHDYFEQGLQMTRELITQDKDAGLVLRESLEALLRYVLRRPLETKIVFYDYRILEQIPELDFVARDQHGIERLWVGLFERAIAEGHVRSDVNPEIAYETISGAIFAAVRWYEPHGPITEDMIVSQQMDMFLGGLRPR
jgi:AcrR family transcriptional regulator